MSIKLTTANNGYVQDWLDIGAMVISLLLCFNPKNTPPAQTALINHAHEKIH